MSNINRNKNNDSDDDSDSEQEAKINKEKGVEEEGEKIPSVGDKIKPENVHIKIDYLEKGLFKEVILMIQDKSKWTKNDHEQIAGFENADLDDDHHEARRYVAPLDTDHRPINTEN